jgi:hypothetical protein
VGEEKLGIFIENDYNILEAFFYGLQRSPVEAYQKMDLKEVAKIERFRRNMSRTVLPMLGFARKVAASFPPEAVEEKVTPEWLLSKGRVKFPKLANVVERYGERGRAWLDRQCRQIVDYLLGRTVYDPKTGRMVDAKKG